MAETINIYDETTGRTKQITVDMARAVLNSQPDGYQEFFMRLTTSAKDNTGASITSLTITSDSDLVLGTTRADGHTVTPYTSYTDAVADYVTYMKSEIDFTR